MSNFRTSSQYKNWIFQSVEELNKEREKKSRRVIKQIRKSADQWNKKEEETAK